MADFWTEEEAKTTPLTIKGEYYEQNKTHPLNIC